MGCTGVGALTAAVATARLLTALKPGRVLFVGDGTSDFCVSGKADFVLAKYKLIEHCRSHGIAHAAFGDFSQALALMEDLVSTREYAAA